MESEEIRHRLEEERSRLTTIRERLRIQDQNAALQSELSRVDQHPAELGSETFERERDLTVLEMLNGQLADVDDALRRLDRGSYGLCEQCGGPIGEPRLEVHPAARYCLEDQAKLEREINTRRQLH